MEQSLIPYPTGETANQYVAARIRAVMAQHKVNAPALAHRLRNPTSRSAWNTVNSTWLRRRLSGEIEMTLNDVQWFAQALEVPMATFLEDLVPDARKVEL